MSPLDIFFSFFFNFALLGGNLYKFSSETFTLSSFSHQKREMIYERYSLSRALHRCSRTENVRWESCRGETVAASVGPKENAVPKVGSPSPSLCPSSDAPWRARSYGESRCLSCSPLWILAASSSSSCRDVEMFRRATISRLDFWYNWKVTYFEEIYIYIYIENFEFYKKRKIRLSKEMCEVHP